jgi:hypothetical protein
LPFTVASGEGDFTGCTSRSMVRLPDTPAQPRRYTSTVYSLPRCPIPTGRLAARHGWRTLIRDRHNRQAVYRCVCCAGQLLATVSDRHPNQDVGLDANNKIVIAWDADNSKFTLTQPSPGRHKHGIIGGDLLFPQSCIKYILRVSGHRLNWIFKTGHPSPPCLTTG